MRPFRTLVGSLFVTLAATATGIPPDRILISATHTHTAPTVGGVFQTFTNPAPPRLKV